MSQKFQTLNTHLLSDITVILKQNLLKGCIPRYFHLWCNVRKFISVIRNLGVGVIRNLTLERFNSQPKENTIRQMLSDIPGGQLAQLPAFYTLTQTNVL